MRHIWLALVALSLSLPARADEAASVLVKTEMPQRGSLPDVLVAYGTAAPALDGGMTLSLPQEGRVLGIAVTPGEEVHKGDRLITFGASAAASSTYQQAVSALALARTQRTHAAQLLGQQLATRDQLAQADKALSDAQSALDALRREGAGQATQDLTAPFDGIVAAVPVAVGDRLQPSTPLLTLTRLDGLVVTVGIEPAVRTRVAPGQPVQLQPLAGDRRAGRARVAHRWRVERQDPPGGCRHRHPRRRGAVRRGVPRRHHGGPAQWLAGAARRGTDRARGRHRVPGERRQGGARGGADHRASRRYRRGDGPA